MVLFADFLNRPQQRQSHSTQEVFRTTQDVFAQHTGGVPHYTRCVRTAHRRCSALHKMCSHSTQEVFRTTQDVFAQHTGGVWVTKPYQNWKKATDGLIFFYVKHC